MPYTYATRSRRYIDVSQAAATDRIKVTLECGAVITFKPSAAGSFMRELEVDRDLTDDAVMYALARHADHHERNGHGFSGLLGSWDRRRYNRSIPSLDEIREQMTLGVSVRADGDAFDDSPLAGEPLSIMVTLPSRGGAGWRSRSKIATVEFYTLPGEES